MKQRRGLVRLLLVKFWNWLGGEVGSSPPNTLPPPPTQISSVQSIDAPLQIYPSPTPQASASLTDSPLSPPPVRQNQNSASTITVQKGDTLFSIADQVNVSVRALVQLNNLASQKIYIGQTLRLPNTATLPPKSPPKNRYLAIESKPLPDKITDPTSLKQGVLALDVEPVTEEPQSPPPRPRKPLVASPSASETNPKPTVPPNSKRKSSKIASSPSVSPPAAKPKLVSKSPEPTLPNQPSAPSQPQTRPKQRPQIRVVQSSPVPSIHRVKPKTPESPTVPSQASKKSTRAKPTPKKSQRLISPKSLQHASPSLAKQTKPQSLSVVRKSSKIEQPNPPAPKSLHFPAEAIQGIYLAYHTLGNRQDMTRLMDLIRRSRINAVVIDVKNDHGALSYSSRVPMAANVAANRRVVNDMAHLVTWFKEADIYTIARLVTFKDSLLAITYPEIAAKHRNTGELWRDDQGFAWVNPFSDDVWDYMLSLAQEVVSFGFDEIQFEALRFPMPGGHGAPQFSRPFTAACRINAVSGFLSTAQGILDPMPVKRSANLLGYASWRQDDSLVGHRLERLAPYLDILSPILCPSSFVKGLPNYANPVKASHEIIQQSIQQIKTRIAHIAPHCEVRPWLQDFPDTVFNTGPLTRDDIQAQITGAVLGKASGFMVWNPQAEYTEEAYLRAN